jgi:two-component system OmpR family sensor kinase
VVAAGAIYAEQRSYLYGRLDQRVVAAAAPISYALGLDARQLSPPPAADSDRAGVGHPARSPHNGGLPAFVPPGTFGEFVGSGGNVLRGPVVASYGQRPSPRPALTARVLGAQPGGSPEMFTVGSTPRSKIRFRVAAVGLSSGAGAVIVAVPLREIDQTLDRLVIVEAAVVAALLIALVGAGWIVIRFALRPLDHMEWVANDITEGDLSHRVSPANSRTEIGRLGVALNRMLVRIEEAFRDRARSEDRLRQFVADASHELRTPLASIRGYAELFRLGPARDPDALERAMARIESEAARMGALVDDLLLLARLEELPESPRTEVDLAELVTHAVTDARATAPARKLVVVAAQDVSVLGDVDALGQVLANLLSNALIHAVDGDPIEVALERDGDEAVLTISDRGPGLPPGSEGRVFERFWRADGGRARGPGGSGLGLSIVREIVEAHHGTVCARNRSDGGAMFTVRLPAVAPALPRRPISAAPAVAGDGSAAR